MGLFSKFFGAPSPQASMPRKPSTPPPTVFVTRPSPVPKPEPSAADLDTTARDVAGAFGDLMQSTDFPMFGASTADVSKLPYPKEVIKASLKYLLMATDDPYLRETIKGSYLTLALFQEGVGAKNAGAAVRDIADSAAPQSDRRNALGDEAYLRETLELVEKMKTNDKWQAICQRDLAALTADIERIEKIKADHAILSVAR